MENDSIMSLKLPAQLHRAVKTIAEQQAETVSEYIRGLIERDITRVERIKARRR